MTDLTPATLTPDWQTEDGSIRLFCRDCLDVLPTLEAGSVDAVVTDPNYGIQADKANAHSSIRDNGQWESLGWDKERPSPAAFDAMLRYSEVAIWGGNYFADLLPASAGWLAWVKPEADTGFSLADMELCWTNKPFAARTRRLPRRDGNLHPTQKPVAVMTWTLEFIDGKSVLDPFMGSGTTGVACIRTGRKFIGIEKEERYFKIACDRIQNELSRYRLFEPPPRFVQKTLMGDAT